MFKVRLKLRDGCLLLPEDENIALHYFGIKPGETLEVVDNLGRGRVYSCLHIKLKKKIYPHNTIFILVGEKQSCAFLTKFHGRRFYWELIEPLQTKEEIAAFIEKQIKL